MAVPLLPIHTNLPWLPPSPLSTLQEVEAKIAARQAVVAGPLKDKFGKLVGLLTAAGGKFMTGDHATYAE